VGKWRYSTAILDLGTIWRWMVSFTPRPLYPRRKSPWYSLNRRVGVPRIRSGRCGVEENLMPLLVIHPSSLYQLSCPGSVKKVYLIYIVFLCDVPCDLIAEYWLFGRGRWLHPLPQGGGNIFLRNVPTHLSECTVHNPQHRNMNNHRRENLKCYLPH
jgi:hypothetical protein